MKLLFTCLLVFIFSISSHSQTAVNSDELLIYKTLNLYSFQETARANYIAKLNELQTQGVIDFIESIPDSPEIIIHLLKPIPEVALSKIGRHIELGVPKEVQLISI